RRDHVDLDAGLFGEGIEHRLNELGLAVGVDVDLSRLGKCRHRKHAHGAGDCKTREGATMQDGHGSLLSRSGSAFSRNPCSPWSIPNFVRFQYVRIIPEYCSLEYVETKRLGLDRTNGSRRARSATPAGPRQPCQFAAREAAGGGNCAISA